MTYQDLQYKQYKVKIQEKGGQKRVQKKYYMRSFMQSRKHREEIQHKEPITYDKKGTDTHLDLHKQDNVWIYIIKTTA